jgi:uncharacterized protein (TIGR02001 family)
VAFPAAAQISGSVSVESDDRFRGYSLSNGQPIATAQLSYDRSSGLYLNGAITGLARHDRPDLLGYEVNLGFARRLTPTISVDMGLAHSINRYRYLGAGYSASYDEAYVGATTHDVSARISYSPHYFQNCVSTLYGELDAGVQPAAKWRLSGHLGALTYLTAPPYFEHRARYDWSLSASRELADFAVHATLSGGGPRERYPFVLGRSGTAVTVGASLSF